MKVGQKAESSADAVKAVAQLEKDEALARQLQVSL